MAIPSGFHGPQLHRYASLRILNMKWAPAKRRHSHRLMLCCTPQSGGSSLGVLPGGGSTSSQCAAQAHHPAVLAEGRTPTTSTPCMQGALNGAAASPQAPAAGTADPPPHVAGVLDRPRSLASGPSTSMHSGEDRMMEVEPGFDEVRHGCTNMHIHGVDRWLSVPHTCSPDRRVHEIHSP